MVAQRAMEEKAELQKISFIGVVEKTRKFFLCSLPENAIKKVEPFRKYSCRIKGKTFNMVVFKGGKGKFSGLEGKVFFLLQPKTIHELKLKLGKIKVELWQDEF